MKVHVHTFLQLSHNTSQGLGAKTQNSLSFKRKISKFKHREVVFIEKKKKKKKTFSNRAVTELMMCNKAGLFTKFFVSALILKYDHKILPNY